MRKIFDFGVQENQPSYIRQRLRISNTIMVVLGTLTVLYGFFVYVKFPELIWLPVFCVLSLAGGLASAALGGHLVYRYTLALVPAFMVFVYHIAVVPAGEPPLVSATLLQFSFSLLPFLLFDTRERISLIVAVTYCFVLLISFRWMSGMIELDTDMQALRHSFRQEFTLSAAFGIVCASMIALRLNARRAEQQSQEFLEKAEERNQELEMQRADMDQNLKKLEEARIQEEKRNWASAGLSKFAGIMRRQDDLQKMYDELMAGLVKYIDANQGGLFLAEGEGKNVTLKLRACYAYGRKKFVENELKPGQSLVGQTYLEQDYIHLTEIPQNYTRITSGLGDATPNALLLMPLITNDKVEGVLELASFKPFEKHVIAFVQQLSEEMAATFGVSKMNVLTQELLQEAKQQAEEMQAQEEEMRQNMEELAATQEEMQRKEQEYLRRIQELEAKMTLV